MSTQQLANIITTIEKLMQAVSAQKEIWTEAQAPRFQSAYVHLGEAKADLRHILTER